MNTQKIAQETVAVVSSEELATPEVLWRRHARYVLILLFIISIVSILDRYILSILLEPIKAEFGVSDTAMGFLTGLAFAVFNALAAIPLARLSDRYSRRLIISIGMAVWSVLTAVQGISKSFFTLALARIGVGVGEATTSPAAHSLIADYFPPERRASAISLYTTGGHVGLMLGLAGGGLLYEWLGWRMTLIVVGLPGIVLAAIFAFTVREPERGANGRPPGFGTTGVAPALNGGQAELSLRATLQTLWAKRTYRNLMAILPLFVFTNYAINTWGVAFLVRVHDMSIAQVGLQLGLTVGLCGASGNIIGAHLCDRLGQRDMRWHLWLPAIAALAMLPALFGFLFSAGSTDAMWCLGVVIFLISFHVSPVYSLSQGLVDPSMRATASAVLHVMSAVLAAGCGPFIIGMLNDLMAPVFGAQAVRFSLCLIALTVVWGSVHALLGARTVRQDLVPS